MSATPVDFKDPDLYQDEARFHAAFAWARANEPVYWNPERDGPGFWAVTRHADIVAVSKNPALFSSAKANGGHRIFDEVLGDEAIDATMISMDPPEHNRYRRMVTPGFTPKRIADLEAQIRERATRLIDRIAHKGEAEFVSTISAELPIQVLAELFGAPQDDRAKLFEWSNAVIGEDDPELRSSQAHIDQCVMDMAMYSAGLWQQRLAQPGQDLISMLAHSRIGGEPMSLQRYLGTFILLVVAGNETTRNSISGGLLALTQNPAERQKLIDDPSLIAGAAAEIVRWVSPVLHMRRTATADTELGNKRIAKGDKVVMWYASGNRDGDVFAEPFRFDVTRKGEAQLGFGVGQHFCLGSRLAELQLKVIFEELLRRLPDIRAVGPVDRLRSNFIHGIKRMHVAFTPERTAAA